MERMKPVDEENISYKSKSIWRQNTSLHCSKKAAVANTKIKYQIGKQINKSIEFFFANWIIPMNLVARFCSEKGKVKVHILLDFDIQAVTSTFP